MNNVQEYLTVNHALFKKNFGYVVSWLCTSALLLVLVSTISGYFFQEYDDTDDAINGHISGVELVTDYGTGCQYLKTIDGFITPRVNNKKHMGCR
jgi:hypothetical protein